MKLILNQNIIIVKIKHFDGFWEGHYDYEIWAKRYELWNHIDIPERFGKNKFNRIIVWSIILSNFH